MTTTVQPGTTTPASDVQKTRQRMPGRGAGSGALIGERRFSREAGGSWKGPWDPAGRGRSRDRRGPRRQIG